MTLTATREEVYEVTLLEPAFGLNAGDRVGLPASQAKPLLNPYQSLEDVQAGKTKPATKLRLHRTGL